MEPVPVWQDYVWPQPDGTVRLLYAPNQRTEFAVPERGPMDTPASFASSSGSSSSPKKVVSKKRAEPMIKGVRDLIPTYEEYREATSFEEDMTEEEFRSAYDKGRRGVEKFIADFPNFQSRVVEVIRKITQMSQADAEATMRNMILAMIHFWDIRDGLDRYLVYDSIRPMFPHDEENDEENPFLRPLGEALSKLLLKEKKSKVVLDVLSSSEEEPLPKKSSVSQKKPRPASPIRDDDDDGDDDEGDEPRAPAAVSKRRGVVKTADGAVKRYLEEYGGGNITALKKRIEEAFKIKSTLAGAQAKELKTWLTEVWFAQNPNREAPSIEEISKKFGNAEKWREILYFQAPIVKKRVSKPKPAEIEEGYVRLTIKIDALSYHYQTFSTGVMNWNQKQPLAFITNFAGKKSTITNLLMTDVLRRLELDIERVRIIFPSMFDKSIMARAPLSSVKMFSFFEGEDRDLLPLVFEKSDGEMGLLHSKQGFSLESISSKMADQILVSDNNPSEGRIELVRMKSQTVPRYHIVFAFHSTTKSVREKEEKSVQWVGFYVFPRE